MSGRKLCCLLFYYYFPCSLLLPLFLYSRLFTFTFVRVLVALMHPRAIVIVLIRVTHSNENFIGLNKSHTVLLQSASKEVYVCNHAFPFVIRRGVYFTNCSSQCALELPVNSDSRLIESAVAVAFDRRCQHVTTRQWALSQTGLPPVLLHRIIIYI